MNMFFVTTVPKDLGTTNTLDIIQYDTSVYPNIDAILRILLNDTSVGAAEHFAFSKLT